MPRRCRHGAGPLLMMEQDHGRSRVRTAAPYSACCRVRVRDPRQSWQSGSSTAAATGWATILGRAVDDVLSAHPGLHIDNLCLVPNGRCRSGSNLQRVVMFGPFTPDASPRRSPVVVAVAGNCDGGEETGHPFMLRHPTTSGRAAAIVALGLWRRGKISCEAGRQTIFSMMVVIWFLGRLPPQPSRGGTEPATSYTLTPASHAMEPVLAPVVQLADQCRVDPGIGGALRWRLLSRRTVYAVEGAPREPATNGVTCWQAMEPRDRDWHCGVVTSSRANARRTWPWSKRGRKDRQLGRDGLPVRLHDGARPIFAAFAT